MSSKKAGAGERVAAYVDGFNLYFGLRSKGWRHCYWLNIEELARNLLKPRQTLACAKYFTARISSPPGKVKRQTTFVEALESLPGLSLFFGKYQTNPQTCPKCGTVHGVPNEKMTDVNIAVEMLVDAHQDVFDTAILISADSDLAGAVRAIREIFPDKRVVVAFPPARASKELRTVAHGSFIGRRKLESSVFPKEVVSRTGFRLVCPRAWRRRQAGKPPPVR